MGPPSQSPDPKSGCAGWPAPMVATYVFELGSSGRVSTGAFQTLLAGNTAHPATCGCASSLAASGRQAIAISNLRILRSWKLPDIQGILAEYEFTVFGGIKIEHGINELQLFIHEQFPTRRGIPGAPDQLAPAEFLVHRLKKRPDILIREFGK